MMDGWMYGMDSMGWGGPWMMVVWLLSVVAIAAAIRWLIIKADK